jgi:hypothetical protein
MTLTNRLKPICHRGVRPLAGRPLSDHLVCLEEERRRDREAQGLRSLQVDDKLKCRGLLDGEVSRLGPFEDLVHVRGDALPLLGRTWPIAHEPTRLDKRTSPEDRRQPVFDGQIGDFGSMGKEGAPVRKHHQCASTLADRRGHRLVDLSGVSRLQELQLHPQRAGRDLHRL